MTADVIARLPTQPVEEPAAWRPADLSSDTSWIHHLSDRELKEIGNALSHVRARGLAACEFGREEFPLPPLSGRVNQIVHELEHGRGCVLIKGLDVERYDMQETTSKIFRSPNASEIC